jgi:hypothetical protein
VAHAPKDHLGLPQAGLEEALVEMLLAGRSGGALELSPGGLTHLLESLLHAATSLVGSML